MPIEVTDVGHSYRRGVPVLHGVSFDVADGELLALTGPSGSGKSTLLQLLGRLLSVQTGVISGRPPIDQIRWVFQMPTALGRRSAFDNVRLGVLGDRDGAAATERAMRAVGLGEVAGQRANTLSGGQLQRIQVARALVGRPPLVIADEPSAQLDRRATEAVIGALRAVRSATTTIIVATHDPTVAAACDRELRIHDGRISTDK